MSNRVAGIRQSIFNETIALEFWVNVKGYDLFRNGLFLNVSSLYKAFYNFTRNQCAPTKRYQYSFFFGASVSNYF